MLNALRVQQNFLSWYHIWSNPSPRKLCKDFLNNKLNCSFHPIRTTTCNDWIFAFCTSSSESSHFSSINSDAILKLASAAAVILKKKLKIAFLSTFARDVIFSPLWEMCCCVSGKMDLANPKCFLARRKFQAVRFFQLLLPDSLTGSELQEKNSATEGSHSISTVAACLQGRLSMKMD